ncbi:hypothetical protein F383_08827 [Gossypium arboreum]|uniref:Uncharacterized protein n=1 Tax=Gossypium arboreum TaxID=29729 RepID=A0A0B0PPZ9_GOSAR|nr:hypothetical protein F383_08827 [Gossypium arboreum]
MFRSRTKEIRFGPGKNESCLLAAPSHFTTSELSNYVRAFVSTEIRRPKAPYEP